MVYIGYMKNRCVCLICFKVNDIWINFLSKFTHYDIYIIIDDNSEDYKGRYSKFTNINIIQIDDEECIKNGFINMNFMIQKKITAWDKSLYYFSTKNTEYNKVWFFEDDCFFYNESSLINIDSKYENSDLLSRELNNTYISGPKNFWHWGRIHINLQPPYYRGMMCCTRVSLELLKEIKNYAKQHNTLFFLEALFPTISKKYNLQSDTPYELKNIVYRKDYIDSDIDKNNIFHPVKDITKHVYYRYILENGVVM